jgi:hypothetical protein
VNARTYARGAIAVALTADDVGQPGAGVVPMEAQGMMGGRWARLPIAGRVALVVVWALLLALSVRYAIRVGLVVTIGLETGALAYMIFATFHTAAVVPLVLTWTAFGLVTALARRLRAGWRGFGAAAVVVAVGWVAWFLQAGGTPPGGAANAFGFYSPFGADVDRVVGSGREGIPDTRVVTNRYGYRDEPWEPAGDGARRVLLVGDSFVWGYGIETAEGMLDRQIERALEAASGEPWEVINIALSPCALPYYIRGLLDVAAVAQPRYLVMSYLPGHDAHPLDEPMLKFGRSAAAVRRLYDFGIVDDVFDHNRDPSRWGLRWKVTGRSDEEALRAQFEGLTAYVADRHLELIVWQHLSEREQPVLAPFHGRPGVHFLDWTVVPGQPERQDAWSQDPRLAYPEDGHPTPYANELVGQAIAAEILRLEAARGRAAGAP